MKNLKAQGIISEIGGLPIVVILLAVVIIFALIVGFTGGWFTKSLLAAGISACPALPNSVYSGAYFNASRPNQAGLTLTGCNNVYVPGTITLQSVQYSLQWTTGFVSPYGTTTETSTITLASLPSYAASANLANNANLTASKANLTADQAKNTQIGGIQAGGEASLQGIISSAISYNNGLGGTSTTTIGSNGYTSTTTCVGSSGTGCGACTGGSCNGNNIFSGIIAFFQGLWNGLLAILTYPISLVIGIGTPQYTATLNAAGFTNVVPTNSIATVIAGPGILFSAYDANAPGANKNVLVLAFPPGSSFRNWNSTSPTTYSYWLATNSSTIGIISYFQVPATQVFGGRASSNSLVGYISWKELLIPVPTTTTTTVTIPTTLSTLPTTTTGTSVPTTITVTSIPTTSVTSSVSSVTTTSSVLTTATTTIPQVSYCTLTCNTLGGGFVNTFIAVLNFFGLNLRYLT